MVIGYGFPDGHTAKVIATFSGQNSGSFIVSASMTIPGSSAKTVLVEPGDLIVASLVAECQGGGGDGYARANFGIVTGTAVLETFNSQSESLGVLVINAVHSTTIRVITSMGIVRRVATGGTLIALGTSNTVAYGTSMSSQYINATGYVLRVS